MSHSHHLDVLVPLAGNDGTSFPQSLFVEFEELLLRLAGGFTRRGVVEGLWRNGEGQIFRDRSQIYSITVPAERAQSIVRAIEERICSAFQQEAAFVEHYPTLATV